jgi:pimeloyl-ACP methyl ester carboxylesterase
MPITRAGDIDIEYYIEGSGPPLLMIMGFGGSADSWGRPFIDELNLHFTTIRFSNRGTGQSTKPTDTFTIRTMADDAKNLLDVLEIQRPHVLGISMGGMIAQEFALNYPERVNGFVLGCTSASAARGTPASGETLGKLAPNPQLSREQVIQNFFEVVCSPDFIARGQAFLGTMTQQALERPTPVETLGKQMMAIQQHDTLDRLSEVKAPTLVLHGEEDALLPRANGDQVHAALPGSEYVTIPVVGHMWFWEEPQTTAKLITDFLSKVPARA